MIFIKLLIKNAKFPVIGLIVVASIFLLIDLTQRIVNVSTWNFPIALFWLSVFGLLFYTYLEWRDEKEK